MGLNFRKSIKIGKNFRINLSKSGVGFSAGVKGARIGIGPKGVRTTTSIPGTGIYSTKQVPLNKLKGNNGGNIPPNGPNNTRAKKNNKSGCGCLSVLAVFIILAIIGGITGNKSKPQTTASKNPSTQTQTESAQDKNASDNSSSKTPSTDTNNSSSDSTDNKTSTNTSGDTKQNTSTAAATPSTSDNSSSSTTSKAVAPAATAPAATSSNENQNATVYITKSGKKYHSAGCKDLRGKGSAISLKDAKAKGYTPCKDCNPPQ